MGGKLLPGRSDAIRKPPLIRPNQPGPTLRRVLRPPALLLVLSAFAIVAFPSGAGEPGVSPDSVAYLDAASSLVATGTLSAIDSRQLVSPLTHFPPLYPAFLSALSLATPSVRVAAIALNIFLFPVTGLAVAFLMRIGNRNCSFLVLEAYVVLVTDPVLVQAHRMAWSEPLFLLTMLAGIICTVQMLLHKDELKWEFASAGLAAMSFLVRYAGVSQIIAGCILCLLPDGGLPMRDRLRKALRYVLIATVAVVPWLVRNRLASGDLADRHLSITLPGIGFLQGVLGSAARWIVPTDMSAVRRLFVLVLLLAVVCVMGYLDRQNLRIALRLVRNRAAGNQDEPVRSLSLLARCLVVLAASYVAVIVASKVFADTTVPADSRIMLPLFVLAVLWTGTILNLAGASMIGACRYTERCCAVLMIGVIVLNLTQSGIDAAGFRNFGFQYDARHWRTCSTIGKLSGLDASSIISSEPPLVRYRTGRVSKDACLPTPAECRMDESLLLPGTIVALFRPTATGFKPTAIGKIRDAEAAMLALRQRPGILELAEDSDAALFRVDQ